MSEEVKKTTPTKKTLDKKYSKNVKEVLELGFKYITVDGKGNIHCANSDIEVKDDKKKYKGAKAYSFDGKDWVEM